MKLQDYLDAYYDFSEKASLLSRQLAFAGVAIIWIFKIGDEVKIQLPASLIYPLLLFISAFIFDLLQYVVGTFIWYFFHRYHEKQLKLSERDATLLASHWYSKFIQLFFFAKLISVFWHTSFLADTYGHF